MDESLEFMAAPAEGRQISMKPVLLNTVMPRPRSRYRGFIAQDISGVVASLLLLPVFDTVGIVRSLSEVMTLAQNSSPVFGSKRLGIRPGCDADFM